MRAFLPTPAVPTGHDEFFAAFDKFGAVSGSHFVDMTIDQLRRYDSENVQYVEFMVSSWCPDDRDRFVKAINETTDDASKDAGSERARRLRGGKAQCSDGRAGQDKDRACVRCAQGAPGVRRHLPLHHPGQSQQSPREEFVQTAI